MKNPVKTIDIVISGFVLLIFLVFSLKPIPFFESLEKIIYGAEMRLNLPTSLGENRIAIVNIDDKSIEQLGQWPWPRSIIAEMVKILKSNGAKTVALDFIFRQKEQNVGLQEIQKLSDEIKQTLERDDAQENGPSNYWILERLERIESKLDNDKQLCEAVKACGNVVMPVVGRFAPYDTEFVVPTTSFIFENAIPISRITPGLRNYLSVDRLITPYPELSKNCASLGHINFSPDEAMGGQAHLPFINFRGHLIPSMPVRLAFSSTGTFPKEAIISENYIRLGNKTIPALKGQILPKYKGTRGSFPYYSFVDILRVKKVPAVFEGKIVLIGLTARDLGKTVWTPVDPHMPHAEFIANITEAICTERYLKRPKSVLYSEIFLLVFLGIAATYILPRLNYFSRTIVTIGVLLGLFLIGVILFVSVSIWFKIIYIFSTIFTLYVAFSVKELIITEKSMALTSRESIETNRMLGLSFQSQGLLDLAFEKFRKCPLDDAMRDVLYNLGLDFERKRMINKAISVYEYILQEGGEFRDLHQRIPKLKKLAGELPLGIRKEKKDAKILMDDDLETRPTVGRYEIIGELGRGAMGMVYKAKDPKINRLVAIKTIRFSDEFDEERVLEVKQRFFREAELAGKLSHPSIISIYDVGEDYDLTYMAMELLEGEDLENFCQKDTLLPLRRVIDIIAETANALDYAHTQGIVHRDIKPANIMLLKNGRIKVTDFGIAKAVSTSQTRSGVILGTPSYMSPEQVSGEQIDGRSDIFSLGVVLFQLTTGQLPFKGKTLTELFYSITQKKHPSPRALNPKVTKPLEQIIDKALAKDPNRRFQRAADFAKYLRIVAQKMDELRAKRISDL